ncbi:SCO family protein [Massilia sp. TSP1-1-2]|uniref:SCO family protein n=1 Tax=unclassified Massilia TaxID=2609279 RepID=UPI003CFA9A04
MKNFLNAASCLALLYAALPAPGLAAQSAVPALAFKAPAPGTYKLYQIMAAPEGAVLETDGKSHALSEFTKGKVTLFSFIYTYCTDAKGCPLAYETLHSLKAVIEQDATLRDKVRFVSMSFDPRNDTPETMRLYGDAEMRDRKGLRWHFLTTRSGKELAPLLDGFGQDVTVAADQPQGARVPVLAHMLKVFLIDTNGKVREIYSTSFLHPTILLNDIRTLLLEPRGPRK